MYIFVSLKLILIDMRNTFVFWFLLIGALALSTLLTSCETDEPASESGQLSFILESGEGVSSSQPASLSSDWSVTGASDWFSVSPLIGGAGTTDIDVVSLSGNTEIAEREGEFTLSASDGSSVKCIVIQRGVPGMIVENESLLVDMAGGAVTLPVRSSVDFEVEYDADWLVLDGQDTSSRVLSDGKTLSALTDWSLKFSAKAYDGEGGRQAEIRLVSSDSTVIITVTQSDMSEVDWEKSFYRRTLAARFTATWCGFCSMMAESFAVAQEELPNRIVPFNLHPASSEGGLHYEGTEDMEKLFNVTMYPTAVFNNYASINNSNVNTCSRIIRQIAEEAVSSFPASTAISASSSVSGDVVDLTVRVAMKEDMNYKVSAFLLESGIVYPQESGGNDYVHNDIVRANVSEIFGDRLPETGVNTVSEVKFSMQFPDNIANRDNLHWVIYVTKPGSLQGEVPLASYIDVGTVVDNVVTCSINGSVDFEYEQ